MLRGPLLWPILLPLPGAESRFGAERLPSTAPRGRRPMGRALCARLQSSRLALRRKAFGPLRAHSLCRMERRLPTRLRGGARAMVSGPICRREGPRVSWSGAYHPCVGPIPLWPFRRLYGHRLRSSRGCWRSGIAPLERLKPTAMSREPAVGPKKSLMGLQLQRHKAVASA